jgi:hypothetical protein
MRFFSEMVTAATKLVRQVKPPHVCPNLKLLVEAFVITYAVSSRREWLSGRPLSLTLKSSVMWVVSGMSVLPPKYL